MLVLIGFIILLVLLLIGVPVPFSFGGAIIWMVVTLGYEPSMLLPTSYSKLSGVVLLAIPLFIMAGGIMEKGQIGGALLNWVSCFVGRIKGGLAIASVVASAIFGSICGSGAATLSCIGSIVAPIMKERKYPLGIVAAVACCAAPLGLLIPPSSMQILVAWTCDLSVLACFCSTVVPGIILTILLSVGSWILLRKNNEIIYNQPLTPIEWGKEFTFKTKSALPALIMPVIILGGIYSGIMTPTESAGIAILYAIPVSMFIYKKMKLKDLHNTFVETACTTGVVMVMIGIVMMMGRVLMMENVPNSIMNALLSVSDNKIVILIMINIFMVIIGMLMDDCSATLLCAPILMPLVMKLGMSPYQFAAVMGVNIGMGNITPPSAPFLYLGARIFKINASEMMRPTVFLLLFAYLPTIILTTYVPELSLWLPGVILGDKFVP
jgi:tripartite ATP-independent transporter DctM subunit